MKSGNLNFLEPSGPLQACNRTTVPFFFMNNYVYCVQTSVTLYPLWHNFGSPIVCMCAVIILVIFTLFIELHYFSSRSFQHSRMSGYVAYKLTHLLPLSHRSNSRSKGNAVHYSKHTREATSARQSYRTHIQHFQVQF